MPIEFCHMIIFFKETQFSSFYKENFYTRSVDKEATSTSRGSWDFFFPYIKIPVLYILPASQVVNRNPRINNTIDNKIW